MLPLTLATWPVHARNHQAEILSALRHLERAQTLYKGAYEPGEWPTEVTSIMLPSLVGVGRWGKPYPEATIFTTASIVGVLHEMHENDSRLNSIPPMIKKAIDGFGPFFQDDFFNFYPLRKRNGAWVRGPRGLFLAPYFRGLANIPPDADTNSVTYLALKAPAPEKVIQAFSRFRDVNRKPHSYNLRAETVNTGAFLTWLMDEKDPKMPHRFGNPELGARIPFGTNDVDCIVNANVLKLLTLQQRTEVAGYKESCRLLQTVIVRKDYGRCGIYYPNDYLLPLRIAELKELGASCIHRHAPLVLKHLLETQTPDGSWTNSPPNRPDRIHATAVALNSLLLLADRKNSAHRQRVDRAVNYLLQNLRRDKHGHKYWKGEVFFSAVAQARYSIVWRSNSYTTALAAQALHRAQQFSD